jgi:hypothetical protein
MLWRQGEAYHYAPDAGAAPACWVSDAPPAQVVAFGTSSAVRSLAVPSGGAESGSIQITLQIQPAPVVAGCAVEEQIPIGWTVRDASEGGVSTNGVLRWGVFFDGAPHPLTYTLQGPENFTVATLRGTASFDGVVIPISGLAQVASGGTSALPRIASVEQASGGSVHLHLAGQAGHICALEASDDLITWTALDDLFLPDGNLDYIDANALPQHRFYRLRIE